MEDNYAAEFKRSVEESLAPPPPKEPKKWLKPAIVVAGIVIAIITLIIITVILVDKFNNPIVTEQGDITTAKESLNTEYLNAVNSTPHRDYESNHKDTAYSNFTVGKLCSYFNVQCLSFTEPEKLTFLESIETLNSNSLDYYLDNGKIVVMLATYSDSVPSEPYPYIIYARAGGLYYVSDPKSEYLVYMTKSEIFDEITGVPQFYATIKGANGN